MVNARVFEYHKISIANSEFLKSTNEERLQPLSLLITIPVLIIEKPIFDTTIYCVELWNKTMQNRIFFSSRFFNRLFS